MRGEGEGKRSSSFSWSPQIRARRLSRSGPPPPFHVHDLIPHLPLFQRSLPLIHFKVEPAFVPLSFLSLRAGCLSSTGASEERLAFLYYRCSPAWLSAAAELLRA